MRIATYKRKAYERLQKIKTRIILTVSAIGLVLGSGGMALVNLTAAHAAPPATIYSNMPSPLPGNVTSEAFEATSTSEFGGQVQFAGTERNNPSVTVLMSSWGCEDGNWFTNDCVTTPGATFSEPVTLNVYNVGPANALGSLVGSKTQTFNIPYRPSADVTNCTAGNVGKWFSAANSTCYNGFATPITFDLTGVTLPANAIVTVAYNTTHYGAVPYGQLTTCYVTSGGCGYDSLNVGLVNVAPSVGTNPVANSDYLNSMWNGAYCDNGVGGTGTLRFDTGNGANSACPYQPIFKVTAVAAERQGFVTGGLTLGSPRQQLSFNAFDFGVNSSADNGTVEYQNFEYAGGLHYTANLLCAWVSGTNARFMYQIPAGYPGLSGLYVVAAVHDGGSPGTKGDTYGHTATADLATANSWCETGAPVSNYPVTGGNAVVHKN